MVEARRLDAEWRDEKLLGSFWGATLAAVDSAYTAHAGDSTARITARDSVVMTTVKKEKLETAELIWDEKTAKVYTDKFVKVTKPGEVIYGFGLEAEQDFSYWKIIVPKGRIKVEQLDEVLE